METPLNAMPWRSRLGRRRGTPCAIRPGDADVESADPATVGRRRPEVVTMSPSLPLCCSSPSFHLLAKQLPTINSPDALLNGAISIAMHQMEDVDPAAVD